MNTEVQSTTNTAATQSAEVVQAFANLDRARETLRAADRSRRDHLNALRRFARKHRLTLRQGRRYCRIHREADYLTLIHAELEYGRALREFRRVAMIAALTRAIDTDRRLNAA